MESHSRCDWFHFCREVILEYVETASVKIGGQGKAVEIEESKFWKRKYHRGHYVRGQWVFGGIERGSGKTFLVAVPDRTTETLVAVIKERIEPGTTVVSDCWGEYRTLDDKGFTHVAVNHSITFVDEETGGHANTIETTWRQVKAVLHPYNRKTDYIFAFAEYMFRKKCKAEISNKII